MDQQAILERENRISGNASFVIPLLRRLMMLYLLVWSVSPPLSIGIVFRVLALACAAGWFILTMITDYQFGTMQKLALIFLLMVILVTLLENQFDFTKLMKQIALYMLVLSFLMSSYYNDKWDELRFLIPLFLLLLIVFNTITFNELLKNANLARRIVRADDSMYGYLRRGVGGYALLYAQVILFPVLLSWMITMKKRNSYFFVLGIIYIVSYALLIYKAGYTIAIVATLAGVSILFFYKKKSIIPGLLIAFGMILLIIWVIGYVDPIRTFLLDLFKGTTVADKVNDIYATIHGTGTAESIDSRQEKYMVSINIIFIRFPFIGSLWNANPGGHSAILDAFAKYGLFGGFMYVSMITFAPRRVKEESASGKMYPVANAMLVSLLIVTLLDSVPYEMIFPIIVMAPLLFSEIRTVKESSPLSAVKAV